MKHLYTISKCVATTVALLFTLQGAKAQLLPDTYFNIDWQLGVPISESFADKTSGWGMNFEGGYFLTEEITVGGFIAYQTNFRSIPRQTLTLSNGSALTTSQKHAIFQLPFGVSGRYNWLPDSICQPYVGLKLGAAWAQISSYYYLYQQYTNTWGFYLSPEAGVSIFPRPDMRFGFHAALYFSYATNSGKLLSYSIDGLTNFGFRVGISF
ncbi:MAG: outer membrane beta-barrel protein [Alistipes sp.]|nr:outer membrane beta-barrel protein [Alistipes sp.]